MTHCPKCGVEYRDGFTTCTDCAIPLVAGSAPAREPEEWVPVFTGKGVELAGVEEDLRRRGFDVVRVEVEQSGGNLPVGMLGADTFQLFTLAVPASQELERLGEIGHAIAEITGVGPGDPEAAAEAEEDYDVRGCPTCKRFFHETYSACPGDNTPLVAAVEIFGADQLAPDYVIMADGTPEALNTPLLRLQEAGIGAVVINPVIGPASYLAIEWKDLTAHTAAVTMALAGEQPHQRADPWPGH